jgi:hypothetical protein
VNAQWVMQMRRRRRRSSAALDSAADGDLNRELVDAQNVEKVRGVPAAAEKQKNRRWRTTQCLRQRVMIEARARARRLRAERRRDVAHQ